MQHVSVSGAMQGPLPAWSTSTTMPALQFLLLPGNWNLTGPLPAGWGAGSSMARLSVLSMHDCNLKGPLPANWSSQLPQLQIIDLTNNLISGARLQTLPQPSPSKNHSPALAHCSTGKLTSALSFTFSANLLAQCRSSL